MFSKKSSSIEQQHQHEENEIITNKEIFKELKKLSGRVGNIEEGILQVNTNVISTKQCVIEEVKENREQVGELKKQIKKLEKNWKTSPYRIIIIFSGCMFSLLLFVKYVY